MSAPDHLRRNHRIHAASHFFTHSKYLDRQTRLFRVFKIAGRYFRDPLGVNILIIYLFSVREGCQDRNLTAGVISFDIRRRILLRIAKLLRLFQYILKIGSLVCHFRKDKVRRSIEDPVDLLDLIGRNALVQWPYDRDAAAHARLKEEIDLFVFCDLDQLGAVCRHQFLV